MRFERRRPGYNRVMGEGAGITVHMFGGLDERAARSGVAAAGAPVETVGDLVAGLALPQGAVGLILLNGLHATLASPLKAGDEVSLFPPIGGG